MKKLFYYKTTYGILDESNQKIYWVNEDLSPIWSNYIHGQKSIYLSSIDKSDLEFICELDFDYVHVTNIFANASLD